MGKSRANSHQRSTRSLFPFPRDMRRDRPRRERTSDEVNWQSCVTGAGCVGGASRAVVLSGYREMSDGEYQRPSVSVGALGLRARPANGMRGSCAGHKALRRGLVASQFLADPVNMGSRPISRVLSWAIIHLRGLSPDPCSSLPERTRGPRSTRSYLALLRVGFAEPRDVAARAVRSYRTISPLPVPEGHRRYAFCCTFRRLAPPRRYLAPCPMEPGLSSPLRARLPGRLPPSLIQ